VSRPLLLAPAAALLAAVAPAAIAGPAEELARKLEERHRRLTDFTARFVQKYRSGTLGREVVERGVVSIKQPGRMRWEYQEPEKKLFVSDGKTFYFYVPADKQVVVREQAGERSVPAQLLSGRGDLLTEFTATIDDSPGARRLRLTPRSPDPEVQSVLVDLDDQARIRSIQVVDAQGNRSVFEFHDIKENVGLKDKLFHFEVPRGVEVVTG
jgi:outer membrane lipoprotein carrier protein